MPTAAKLFGALSFAVLGWLWGHVFSASLPEGAQVGFMREIVAGVGLVAGWRVAGKGAGKGYYAAMGNGTKTGIVTAFFALLGFGLYEMVVLSTKMRYDGPMEAVLDVFNIMLKYGRLMLTSDMIVSFVAGSVVGGWITEFAGRHWR